MDRARDNFVLCGFKQAPMGLSNVIVKDRVLLNKGTFQCICLFWKMSTCLLDTGCLHNTGGQYWPLRQVLL